MQTPPHVRPDQIVDVDIYTDARLLDDPHLGWRSFHGTPDIFFTPRNGGHWVVARCDLMYDIGDPAFIPLSLDPPDASRSEAVTDARL